mmetsp:Transcript_374/g.349  ORF Transcript_374/g.349 Transcript_374/m.349 type:complete len:216 (-) Transcript_374:19-666(-)
MKFESTLHEYEDYLYDNINKKIKDNPKEVRFTTIELASEHSSDWSQDRINFLKKNFKNIIDNIVSLETKCFIGCFKDVKMQDLAKKMKNKKRRYKYQNKKIEELRNSLFEGDWSEALLKGMDKYANIIDKKYKIIRKIVQTLVKLRNQLFNTYQELKKAVESSEEFQNYEKKDIVSLFEFINKVRDTEYVQNHNLWVIPKKDHNNKTYNSGELSE